MCQLFSIALCFSYSLAVTQRGCLAEEPCECLDAEDMVGCAARLATAMHGEDGIAHIDTSQGYRRSEDIS